MLFARWALSTKTVVLLAVGAVSGSPGIAATSSQALASDRAGAVYEISKDLESTGEGSNGSTSSSTDRDTLLERVIRVRRDGLELEYDLPKDATAQDRANNWQFPVRVFKPLSGPSQLLNRPELEGRIEGWLKKSGLTRAACGRWVFTWNAFKVECDPQSALVIVAAFDLRPIDLRDGFVYNDPQAFGPVPLRQVIRETGEVTFTAVTSVDPEHVRRELAQSDIVVAEVLKKTLTFDDAVRARSSETVSGTILISFEANPAGFVRQRTKVTKLAITEAAGQVEHRTTTEIIKRRLVTGE